MSDAKEMARILSLMGRKRGAIKKAEARATELKKEYREMEEEVKSWLKTNKLESVSSRSFIASRSTQEVAKITDYAKLRKWIYQNDALDLFQNRLSITSIRERREHGEKIPGIMTESIPKLNLRKK